MIKFYFEDRYGFEIVYLLKAKTKILLKERLLHVINTHVPLTLLYLSRATQNHLNI